MPVNEAGKGNRRFFAITSLGAARWYWVVWPSLRELQSSEIPISHIAEGVEKTKADAVEKALNQAGVYAKWIAGKYARAYHQKSKVSAGKGNKTHSADSSAPLVLQAFLYQDVLNAATQKWESVPHRVVRKTSKYVYVEQQPHSTSDVIESWPDDGRPMYRLDRQALERDGYAFIPATAALSDTEQPLFFMNERTNQQADQTPECLKVLDLSWPCTTAQVQDSYRRLVKRAHPDGGGSHNKFLELRAAYEQALRLCR